jgi:quaternary ammonium compound-resistance protein SugE
MAYWLALLVSVAANISSNFALKRFTQETAGAAPADGLLHLLLKPWLWLGIVCAGVVMLSYLFAIRGLPLSVAYPVATGLSAAGICLIGAFVFGESIKLSTLSGIVLIVAGVMLVSR